MRVIAGGYRRRLRIRRRRRGIALCGTLRDSAVVAGTGNLRTADYSEEDRARLGNAVAEARRAAGYRWRPAFIRDVQSAGIELGKRSLEAIERHEVGVGISALEEVGRALGLYFEHWGKEMPRKILDGAEPPVLEHRARNVDSGQVSPVITASVDSAEFWVALRDEVPEETFRILWGQYQELMAARRSLAERDKSVEVP